MVDDCPKMHGGGQKITLPNGPTLPLQYFGGLSYIPMRKPSQEELNTLPIIDITSSEPWYPKMNETELTEPPMSMRLEMRSYMEETMDDHWNFKTTTFPTADMDQVQRCLGWKPTDIIKETLKNTTQLAQNHVRLPMRQHFQSQCPALHVRRLRETFATDTFFSSEKALGGFSCAQLYVRKTSTFCEIYGMKRAEQMPETLQDFIRQWGAPSGLFSDSAVLETSKAVKDILRHCCIKDMQSEPNHQHQNYAERKIQDVKSTAIVIMDRVGAPSYT